MCIINFARNKFQLSGCFFHIWSPVKSYCFRAYVIAIIISTFWLFLRLYYEFFSGCMLEWSTSPHNGCIQFIIIQLIIKLYGNLVLLGFRWSSIIFFFGGKVFFILSIFVYLRCSCLFLTFNVVLYILKLTSIQNERVGKIYVGVRRWVRWDSPIFTAVLKICWKICFAVYKLKSSQHMCAFEIFSLQSNWYLVIIIYRLPFPLDGIVCVVPF